MNLNKPFGFTSHDCVAKVRKLLKLKKVGHAGTLDPAAMGVLPIAVGRATRLLQYLRSQKAYRAVIRFGVTTATDDLEGETLTEQAVPNLTLDAVQEKLPWFQGKLEQIPPSYSAIQVQGKRLYDLAREGKAIAVPARSVEVYRIEVLNWTAGDFPELEVAIACGAGTYIRSIARDLGAAVQTGATLAKLIRTESSGFELTDSVTFEQLEQEIPFIAPDAVLNHLPSVKLESAIATRWRQGQKLPSDLVEGESGIVRVYECDRFLGIGEFRADGLFVPQMVYEPI